MVRLLLLCIIAFSWSSGAYAGIIADDGYSIVDGLHQRASANGYSHQDGSWGGFYEDFSQQSTLHTFGSSIASIDTTIDATTDTIVLHSDFVLDRPSDIHGSFVFANFWVRLTSEYLWTLDFVINWPETGLAPSYFPGKVSTDFTTYTPDHEHFLSHTETGLSGAQQRIQASGVFDYELSDHTISFRVENSDRSTVLQYQGMDVAHDSLVTGSFTFTLTPVPEPSSMVLLGFGSIGFIAASRRRKS